MTRAFDFRTAPDLRLRPGGAARLAEACAGRLGGRILFVNDLGIVRLGLAEPAFASLRAAAEVSVFDAVEANPSRVTLIAAVAAVEGARGVIGFGGGSSLDVAKLATLLLGSGEELDAAWGVGNARGPRLPLVLVPTTAGTGSQVTPVSIITLPGGEKARRLLAAPPARSRAARPRSHPWPAAPAARRGRAARGPSLCAAEAMKQTRLLVNNPREVTEADALAIYEAGW